MGKLDQSFIYKNFKGVLVEKYGQEKASCIWNEANEELMRLLIEYKNIGSDEKSMVLPLSALYMTLIF